RAAQRFRKAREGIRALKHVTEQVVFLGTAWKWVWMYEVGGRKLGYLHPMKAGVSGTFVLTEIEEREFSVADGLPRPLRQAMRGGAVSAGVRWWWMEFPDLDAVDAFVGVIQLKHQFLARPECPTPAPAGAGLVRRLPAALHSGARKPFHTHTIHSPSSAIDDEEEW